MSSSAPSRRLQKNQILTNENIGDGKLELPENEMHTSSYWITLERPLLESLPFTVSERQSGMFGLLHALESVATLLLMCDRRDLGTAIGERPPAADSESASAVVGAQHAAPLPCTIENFTPSRMEDAISPNAKEFFEPIFISSTPTPAASAFLNLSFERTLSSCKKRANSSPPVPANRAALPASARRRSRPRAKEAALAILDRLCA